LQSLFGSSTIRHPFATESAKPDAWGNWMLRFVRQQGFFVSTGHCAWGNGDSLLDSYGRG